MGPLNLKAQSAGRARLLGAVSLSAFALAVGGCGGGDDDVPAQNVSLTKASCGSGDRAETGLQGQIPMAERTAGFQGFNCNLQKVSALQPPATANGKRLFQQTAVMHDSSGHTCVYGGGAFLEHLGTLVFDVTDPSNPVQTADLTTPAMQNPGEGLKVHQGRGLLISGYYHSTSLRTAGDILYNGTAITFVPPALPQSYGFDVYDIKTDCRHPQLLATTTAASFSTVGLSGLDPATAAPWASTTLIYGHEGMFSPDGLTYYNSDAPHGLIHAMDVTDPTNPKVLATYQFPYVTIPHGLSVRADGNRTYLAQQGKPGPLGAVTGAYHNGFSVVDTSDIQARKPNAVMRFITEVVIRDGGSQQIPLQVKIKGKPYVLAHGEAGSANTPAAACAAGLTPFAKVKIFDIENEQYPVHVNDISLETNDPKNCPTISPDIALPRPLAQFLYDVHQCSVDNRDEATTLSCSYWESGIRVYDIRDPEHVKEIAYFNPAATTVARPGTGWCASMAILDAHKGMLHSYCQETGVVTLKFTNGVWPLPGSVTPIDRQL